MFQFLHISVLREYLNFEFNPAEAVSPPSPLPAFDLENTIDDFVMMCFLVGNDFMPHLPSLDIGEGGLDTLFKIYKELPANTHLVKDGKELNLSNLEHIFEKLALVEEDVFQARLDDEVDFKRRQRKYRDEDDDEFETKENGNGPTSGQEFKARYYKDKFPEFFKGSEAETQKCIRQLCESYLQACYWCLQYYYQGCSAWQWFYPYRYAPLASDMKRLHELNLNIPAGSPFQPLQQLMGVLPPASSKLLPPAWRDLMTNSSSPVKDFYPDQFEIDMNGKKSPWEGIALIPFIDEKRLLSALATVKTPLSAEETARNTPGTEFVFKYYPGRAEEVRSTIPRLFPTFFANSIAMEWRCPDPIPFKPTLLPGCTMPYAGYPTLQALPCKARLAKVSLNVFGRASTKETLVLCPQTDIENATAFGHKLVGRRCFSSWPYLNEALVMGAADTDIKIALSGTEEKNNAEQFRRDAMAVSNHLLTTQGIETGPIKSLLTVRKFRCMRRMEDGRTKKWFDKDEVPVPAQLILTRNKNADPRYEEKNPPAVEEQFPIGAEIVYLGAQHQGEVGVVTGYTGATEARKVSVRLARTPADPHFGREIARHYTVHYIPTFQAAKKLGIPAATVGKIMGNVPFDHHRDLGLQLKSTKLSASVPEFVIQGPAHENDPTSGAPWLYSEKAINLMSQYMQKFPALFLLINSQNDKVYDEKSYRSFRAKNDDSTVNDIVDWLRKVTDEKGKISKRVLTPCTSQVLAPLAVEAIEAAASKYESQLEAAPHSLLDLPAVPITDIYRKDPDVQWSPSKEAPQIGDRVISLRSDQGVPFGFRGTVIGVHEDAFVDVVFDRRFLGGETISGSCSDGFGKTLPISSLLVLVDPKGAAEKKAAATATTPSSQLARLRLTESNPMGFPMPQLPFAVPASSPRSHKGYTATPASMSSPRTQQTFEQAMAATPRGLDMMALQAMGSPRFFDPNAPVNLVPFNMDPIGRNPSHGHRRVASQEPITLHMPNLGNRTASNSRRAEAAKPASAPEADKKVEEKTDKARAAPAAAEKAAPKASSAPASEPAQKARKDSSGPEGAAQKTRKDSEKARKDSTNAQDASSQKARKDSTNAPEDPADKAKSNARAEKIRRMKNQVKAT